MRPRMRMTEDEAREEITLARRGKREARLCDANLQGAELFGTDLSGTNLYGAILFKANLHKVAGIIEIGGLDWSLYLIRGDDGPRVKGGICQWFETRTEAEAHWMNHSDQKHGALMLAKLDAAWFIATQQGWPGTKE